MKTRSSFLLLGILAVAAAVSLVLLLRGGGPEAAGDAVAMGPTEDAVLEPGGETSGLPGIVPDAEEETQRQALGERAKEQADSSFDLAALLEGPLVRGHVVDSDGYPVPDADIKISARIAQGGLFQVAGRTLTEEARTDEQGAFRLARGKLLTEELTVEVSARGHLVQEELRVAEEQGDDIWLGTFVVQRGVVLGGEVVDAEGLPVAGATVRCTRDGEQNDMFVGMMAMNRAFGGRDESAVDTDAEGRFELRHEDVGEYVLIVDHETHPRLRYEGKTPTIGGEDLNLFLQLAPTARIAGRILDYPEGREGVHARATAVQQSGDEESSAIATMLDLPGQAGTHTSKLTAKGEFAFEGLEVDREYRVQAIVQDGMFQNSPCTDLVTVTSGETEVELTWDAGASVSFQVKSAKSNNPLTDVTVRYRWVQRRENGMPAAPKKREYGTSKVVVSELRPLSSPAELELIVSSPGYLELHEEALRILEREDVDLGVVLLERAPALKLSVVDAATGEPVRRARVRLEPEEEGRRFRGPFTFGRSVTTGKTDSDGACELPACSTPTARLKVRARGFAPYESEGVPMPRDLDQELTVSLLRGAEIEVLVQDTLGGPVGKARVEHRLPDDSTDTRQASAKGIAVFKNLAAGEHAFRASRPIPEPPGRRRRGAQVTVEVDGEGQPQENPWTAVGISSGGESSLTLEVPAKSTLTGRIRARGSAVAHAQITLLRGEETSASDLRLARMSKQMERMMGGRLLRARSDSSGRFELDEVPVGKHRLRVERESGSPPYTLPVEIAEGQNHVDFELPSATIEGRVVNQNGRAVERARVSVRVLAEDSKDRDALERVAAMSAIFGTGAEHDSRAGIDGTFTIDGVPAGVPLVVDVRADGHVDGHSQELQLDEDELKKGVEIVLEAAGSIRVNVLGEGSPFQMITARPVDTDDEDSVVVPKFALVRSGGALLEDVKPGRWRVSVARRRSRGGDNEGQMVRVRGGEEAEVTLDL